MTESRHERADAETVLVGTAENPLSDSIAGLLAGADGADLAVGYLFAEGLAPLVDVLGKVPRIRLLIGNVVNRLTDEQLREAGISPPAANPRADEDVAAAYRETRDRAAGETALNLTHTISALDHSDRNRALLLALANWIASGRLSVRLSTRGRLHAKAAIARYPASSPRAPGAAIVGTSNLSMPRSRRAGEPAPDIDVLVRGARNYDQVAQWFEQHWNEAQDFHRELFSVLGQTWPLADS